MHHRPSLTDGLRGRLEVVAVVGAQIGVLRRRRDRRVVEDRHAAVAGTVSVTLWWYRMQNYFIFKLVCYKLYCVSSKQ